MKTEVLYGTHAVKEALAAGRREVVEICVDRSLRASGRLQGILSEAATRRIAVREMDPEQIASLAGTSAHQGVAARASVYGCRDLSEVLDAVERPASGLVLALDQIMDPHNLGALLRTALCAGVEAVLVPKDRSAPPTPAVSKISAGALEHIRLIQVTNLARALELLKTRGLWVVGLDRSAADSLFSGDFSLNLVLVIGGEGRGMRPLVRRTCDLLVSIPQMGPLDSLNASVAAGIALFEIGRQRAIHRLPNQDDSPDGRRKTL
ncbi:MAG: 23S rRNA (guanosine(2251)-2'-O)-methyltransferase RlmB [Hyphomicrobiales bacterium]